MSSVSSFSCLFKSHRVHSGTKDEKKVQTDVWKYNGFQTNEQQRDHLVFLYPQEPYES